MSIDMERQIHAYAEYLDSTLPVLEADEAMVERIGAPPVRPLRERTLKPAVPGWVWAVVAAAVTIVVGVVAIVLFRLADEEADVIQPAPTTVPVPTTVPEAPPFTGATTVPQEPPETVIVRAANGEPFTADSSIGTWTWTPIDVRSEPAPLPEAHLGDEYFTTDGGPYLVSDDGLAWSNASAPGNFVSLVTEGDALYAVSESRSGLTSDLRASVWRHESGSWIEMPVPEVVVPDVEGLALVPELGSVRVAGSAILVSVVVIDDQQSFFDPDSSPLLSYYGLAGMHNIEITDTAEGQIELINHEGEVGRVALIDVSIVDGNPVRIEFRDTETGDLVHVVATTVDSLGASELRAAILERLPVGQSVFLSSSSGAFEEIAVPWVSQDQHAFGDFELAGLNGELLALVGGEAQSLWRSADGRSWERVAPTGVGSPIAINLAGNTSLAGGGDRAFLLEEELTRASTDGESWEVVEDLRGEAGVIISAAPFGWFATAGGGWFPDPMRVFVSTDGITWQEVEAPPDLCRAVLVGEAIFGYGCNDGDGSVIEWTRWTAKLGGG